MRSRQAAGRPGSAGAAVALRTERLGPLPLINHFLQRLTLPALLEQFVPTPNPRAALPYATGLGVLLRSILVEREPIYRQHETVRGFAPAAYGLRAAEVDRLQDDQLGTALDRLFRADRGSLLTTAVVAAGREFGVNADELHNDSTTVRFTGQYRPAPNRSRRGRRRPWITYGHSKDHRPDLKQLLIILTTTADGAVPVQFRCADGNTEDSGTHRETWETLHRVTGRVDFLYVADSKLCSGDALNYIDAHQGRLVTVLPRSRREDGQFREWLQTHEPEWEEVWNRPHPRRRRQGPRDIWRVCRDPLPSREGWPLIWVSSALLALHQEHARRERLTRALQELEGLQRSLAGPRPRQRAPAKLEQHVATLVASHRVEKYLQVRVVAVAEHRYRQESRGRPGRQTRYRRLTRQRLKLEWQTDEAAIAADRRSDGMYPLLTNDRALTPRQVLEAHKRQPAIEKRFEQTKTVFEIAPVFLKNEGRIEALFFLYFLALLVQALIERELRRAMHQQGVKDLPLYPEDRASRRPTAEQIFRLFALVERHDLRAGEHAVQSFEPELTEMQQTVLRLLGVPHHAYGGSS